MWVVLINTLHFGFSVDEHEKWWLNDPKLFGQEGVQSLCVQLKSHAFTFVAMTIYTMTLGHLFRYIMGWDELSCWLVEIKRGIGIKF